MKLRIKLLFTLLMITVMLSCSKDDPNTSPDPPLIGTATAGDTEANITFTAPSNDGGSTVTRYTATSTPDNIAGILEQAESGTITVTGLTNGIEYTFTVTATNAIGTSMASSESNAVTPAASPEWHYNCYPVYDNQGNYLYDDCYWEFY